MAILASKGEGNLEVPVFLDELLNDRSYDHNPRFIHHVLVQYLSMDMERIRYYYERTYEGW